MDDGYFRLGETEECLPEIGEELDYMGIIYEVKDIEPTEKLVHSTSPDGIVSHKKMYYIVMMPLRPTPEFERQNPGQFEYWKAKYFPEHPLGGTK